MQEYEEWMKEKAPRRTSDDCHTPADVYEVAKELQRVQTGEKYSAVVSD